MKNFNDTNKPDDKLWKFKLICFNFDYKVMNSMSVIDTDENKPLNGTYYKKISLNEIKNCKSNSKRIDRFFNSINEQNKNFTFKERLRETVLFNDCMSTLIGINWQSDPDYTVIPQKDNDYYFFVPEFIDFIDKHIDSDICHFKGINTGMHFEVHYNYDFVRFDDTENVDLNKVYFLF